MKTRLFLASTPLHILNSVAIASSSDGDSHIWLIDQPDITDNPYFEILTQWKDSPFATCNITQGGVSGPLRKLQSRHQTFSELRSRINSIKPDYIFTGNDRRIEFQYAMHLCRSENDQTRGVYMDEGTFTYVGRHASSSFSDRVIDHSIKKAIYGRWWKTPETIGGSAWVDKVYAAFPELIHPLLKEKQVLALQECFTENGVVKKFCQQLARYFSITTDNLQDIDTVLTLPHESIIEKISGYQSTMKNLVEALQQRGMTIGIKYHPRNINPDILDVTRNSKVISMPHKVPFEALLPLLKENIIVVGDVSSTLINSCWLKPASTILSVANENVELYSEFCDLFRKLQVPVLNIDDLQGNLNLIIEQGSHHIC